MDDHNLIFLISQPRSGSTLLQHILGSHSEIHTLPEPWLMLHQIYGLRSSGIETDYQAQYAYINMKRFLEITPNGEEVYEGAIRNMTLQLYENALQSSGKKYFLDKTPRYYFIIPDLYRLFPRAKFIFILRNPMAVLSSLLTVIFNGNWQGLFERDRKHDILTAPHLILEGIKTLGSKAIVVNYEKLVTEPTQTVKKLCHKLEIAFENDMINYGGKLHFKAGVDPKSIYKHTKPVRDYADGWWKKFDTPQKVYIARNYIETLGRKTISDLGYSYDDLMNKLTSLDNNQRKPYPLISWKLITTPSEKLSCFSKFKITLLSSLQSIGFWHTLWRCISFITRKIH
ncbi:MAG: sulfotransferase [Deltaproteobacteria bacterium]|nr:sulfotransferase [Deltaproteobacteria bacterium]